MYASRLLRSSICTTCNKYSRVLKPQNLPKNVVSASPRLISTIERESPYKNTFMARLLNKLPFVNVNKTQILASGYILYENIVDKLDYMEFFETLDLPDSFYSWFVITELHLWMVSVRTMAEGEDGRLLRNYMVQALWNDVAQRSKKIGKVNATARRHQVNDLSEQLQAALIAYDEGLHSDDVVLAAALWRRIYQLQDVEPKYLEYLVQYVRRQIRSLDKTSSEDFFVNKRIIWEPLNKIIK